MIPLKFAVCFLFVGLANLMSCQASITQGDWAAVQKRLDETFYETEEHMLIAAKNWLEELRNSETKPSEGVVEALELLERFRVILFDDQCDRAAKEFRKWLQSELNEKNERLASVISWLSCKNSNRCFKLYHESYMSQLKHYPDQLGLKRMELFFFELFYSTLTDGSSKIRKYVPFQTEVVGTSWIHIGANDYNLFKLFISESGEWPARAWELIGDIGFDTVDALAGREHNTDLVKSNTQILENRRIVIDASGAQEIFSRLILDSCETFIQFYGPNIFELAESDIEYFEITPLSFGRSSPLADFLLYWAQYKGCSRLIQNERERSRLLGLIGEVADREAEERAATIGKKPKYDGEQGTFVGVRGTELERMNPLEKMELFRESTSADIPGLLRMYDEQVRRERRQAELGQSSGGQAEETSRRSSGGSSSTTTTRRPASNRRESKSGCSIM